MLFYCAESAAIFLPVRVCVGVCVCLPVCVHDYWNLAVSCLFAVEWSNQPCTRSFCIHCHSLTGNPSLDPADPPAVFTARYTTVQSAVLRSHVVCPSVTLVDHDHIGWKSWKLTVQTISPTSSLFAALRSSTYSHGNTEKLWGENVRSTATSITSGWIESTESHVILGGGDRQTDRRKVKNLP